MKLNIILVINVKTVNQWGENGELTLNKWKEIE